jgi:hypothetical protein
MDYTSKAASLNEVKTNPATKGLIGSDYDTYLDGQLDLTAGKNAANQTIFRPYYVAAKFLEQIRSQQTIRSADGAVFTGLALPIASLLGQQAAIDTALGLIVPPGFEAVVPGAESSSSSGLQRFGTRSSITQIRP